jgi:hypothetical protein
MSRPSAEVNNVAFLDLLGFKFVQNYSGMNTAKTLLWDANDIAIIMAKDSVTEKTILPWSDFLFFSDSIIVLSKSADSLMMGISQFLTKCFTLKSERFAFSQKGDKDSFFKLEVKVLRPGMDPIIVTEEETWYPCLFRGAVAYGEAEAVLMQSISAKEIGEPSIIDFKNIVGAAFIKVVGLEKVLKGPRILIDESTYCNLSRPEDVYVYPSFDSPGLFELYWPLEWLKYHRDFRDTSMNFTIEVQSVLRLWKFYYDNYNSVSHQYQKMFELFVMSVFHKYPKQISDINKWIDDIGNRAGIPVSFNLLDNFGCVATLK